METWAYAAAHISTQQSTILRIIADSIGVSSSLSVINASVWPRQHGWRIRILSAPPAGRMDTDDGIDLAFQRTA